MKFTIFFIATLLTFTVTLVNAKCSCDPADTDCLADCVTKANKCITDCQSNSCYTRCIKDHWPGGDSKSQEDVISPSKPSNESDSNNKDNKQNTSTSSILIGPAPTASASQPGPSSPSGTPSHTPTSSNLPAPSNSSANNYHISKVVVGFAVIIAVYFLQ
ncbi:hypothetical protein BDF20DRAFT_853926 [Mycotypha africana]|uniref:uncharacterized protein n=1 Tax=Mycotypha africana TaxID=64632 RepID=UPI00230114D7|nr:uncharacterized protein BDF20DRAFT_853926 [Mycotypha africana]KAI8988122.1 hypothetical protein BDF20DRAFT_853926 [Mycotypha africana]